MKKGTHGARHDEDDGVAIPSAMPLLPLPDQVLLPSAYARIAVPASSWRSMALVDHLLEQRGSNVLIAVVPQLKQPEQQEVGSGQIGKPDRPPQAASRPDRKAKRGHQVSKPSTSSANKADGIQHLHALGTAARVLQLTRNAQSGNWVLVVEGCCRVRISAAHGDNPYYVATVAQLECFQKTDARFEAEQELDAEASAAIVQLQRAARQLLGIVSLTTGAAAATRLAQALDKAPPAQAADLLAAALTPSPITKLKLLDAVDVNERLQLTLGLLKEALRAAGKAVGALGDTATAMSGDSDDPASVDARTAALRRLQAAQRGLPGGAALPPGSRQRRRGTGDVSEEDDELLQLRQRLEAAFLPPDVYKVAMRELKRLERSSEQHPGHAMSRTYLETLADLPWNSFAARPSPAAAQQPAQSNNRGKPGGSATSSADEAADRSSDAEPGQGSGAGTPSAADISREASGASPAINEPSELSLMEARALLDRYHHGLDKAKTRIVQYLAVRRLRGPDAKAPILCLVGPPGVGKTTLARSVAEALGRPLQRISLGGVRDEAEIRGHRRTYIGAMPGRVIQAIKRAGVRDGVLLFDEVDKLGHDSRGDPSSALLEVLDPEQNAEFVDTYLGVPFDLSSLVFLATANRLGDIPPPLLDRLEVVYLSSYTTEEKVHIAQQHLMPKLLAEHGLSPAQLEVLPEAIETVVTGYTREAGVRALSRALAAICRHVAVNVVQSAEQQRSSRDGSSSCGDKDCEDERRPSQPQPVPSADPDPAVFQLPARTTYVAGRLMHAAGHRRFWSSGARTQSASGDCSRESRSSSSGDGSNTDSADGSNTDNAVVQAAGNKPKGLELQHAQAPSQQQHQRAATLSLQSVAPWSPAHEFTEPPQQTVRVDEALIEEVLGPRRLGDHDAAHRVAGAGSAAGLVWTEAGGQVQYVECIATGAGQSGRPGALTLTGQMGEVLEESARIALSWIRAHATSLPLLPPDSSGVAGGEPLRTDPTCWDIHVHLPAGAVPKDGPSAGVTMASALASLVTGRSVRADTAMTGELTLRGLVLPVGGVKEKLIAAHQAGMTRVIIPAHNMRDVKADLPQPIREALQILPVRRLEQVLEAAFDPPLRMQPHAKL